MQVWITAAIFEAAYHIYRGHLRLDLGFIPFCINYRGRGIISLHISLFLLTVTLWALGALKNSVFPFTCLPKDFTQPTWHRGCYY